MKVKKSTALICAAAAALSCVNVYAADGGSGSASDPYGISTEADLMEIMFDPSANYELLCDITVDTTPHDTVFSGRLDGNGHSITMNGGESLFSEVSGTVEELALSGSAKTAGGLLADRLTGTVTRSMFVGDVSLQDAESGGAIAGSVEGGTVTDCLTDVTVEGTAANAGSIAGKVTNSNISNCFITGSVSAVGGAVAPVIGTAENSQISGIYYDSSVNTAPYGIFVGSGTTAAVDEASLTAAASYPDLAFGSVWTIAEGSTYPMLIACSGAGTESEPYRLHFFDDLQNILTKTYTQNKYYRLENDISGYQAIGYADSVFNGKFDGNGHKLSTLSNIFETIDENGVVENLIRECSSTIKTNGIYGGIANINYGTIRNCHVSCTINAAKDGGGIVGENIGGTVSGCSFEGSVSVSESGAGGIVGYNSYGTIENCVSDARVSAQDHGAGGIVGDNSFGTVKNCRSDGSLRAGTEVGGIAGRLYNGSILTSYSIASVTTDSAAGGIFGTQIENGYVENSYYLKNYNDPDMDAEQSASFGFDEDALYRSSSYAGFDFDNVWAIDEGRDMPALRSVEGAGTKAQPYIIRFESDIDNIKGQRKLYYELACNISMDGSTGAEFTGALNGNGHTIDGIGTIFETVSDGAYISNIVTNGVARIADSVSNAAIEYCTMYDCVNIAETLDNCTVTGCRTIGSNNNNNRRQSAGGFADTINGGSIKYCSAADKTVSGSSAAGGFAGIISGADIDSCFAYNVTVTGTAAGGFLGRTDAGTSISNSSAYGAVTAGTYSGAFAGMNYGSVSGCAAYDTTEASQLGAVGHNEGSDGGCVLDAAASLGKIYNTGGIGTTVTVPDIGEDTAVTAPEVTLSDISGHWAETTIRSLVSAGVISGYEDGTYRPQNSVTKGEFIKLLLAADGAELQTGFTNYEDVNKSWAKDNVYTALSLGICDNISDSGFVFGVDTPITRAQAAALMGRLVGDGSGGALNFTDSAAVPEWAAVPLADCVRLGLITGMGDGSFAPGSALTRAEAAVIVERVMEL